MCNNDPGSFCFEKELLIKELYIHFVLKLSLKLLYECGHNSFFNHSVNGVRTIMGLTV